MNRIFCSLEDSIAALAWIALTFGTSVIWGSSCARSELAMARPIECQSLACCFWWWPGLDCHKTHHGLDNFLGFFLTVEKGFYSGLPQLSLEICGTKNLEIPKILFFSKLLEKIWLEKVENSKSIAYSKMKTRNQQKKRFFKTGVFENYKIPKVQIIKKHRNLNNKKSWKF